MSKFIKNYHNKSSLYINPEKKWLWLRIHKTAGTSMYDGFLIGKCYNDPKESPEKAKHWLKTITEKELKDYFIWACVRNPYDRFNSTAAMFNLDPNEFARNFEKHINSKGIIYRHSQPQHLFTHFKGVQVPKLIIKFEDVTEGFKTVCKKLDLPKHELTKLNHSIHGKWEYELSKKTINFVNEYYKLDFKYFGYDIL